MPRRYVLGVTRPVDQAQRADDPLIIRDLQFLGGMATVAGWRPAPELPEIAFSGRSNVGKSSLLNSLVRRRAFARVSNTPGRTREVNFFQVNKAFLFVDLPGYGYARVSKAKREEWQPLIEGYLRNSPPLRGVVQLVDARHDPSVEDRQMFDLLADIGVPAIVAATKTDKLGAMAIVARTDALVRLLGVDREQVIAFSAVTGAGRDELAEAVMALLDRPSWRGPS